MPHTIRALIFDFDGVVVDTELPSFLSWKTVYSLHRLQLSEEDWISYFLGEGENLMELLRKRSLRAPQRGLSRTREEIKLALSLQQPLCPGVSNWLFAAKEQGLKLAIATNGSSNWVRTHLDRFGLNSTFEAIVTARDVKKPKPAPDVFLLAADQLGVHPNEALIVEDSPIGVMAAKAAQMSCVVVKNSLTQKMAFPSYGVNIGSLDSASLVDTILTVTLNTNID